jgi:urease accessory protein
MTSASLTSVLRLADSAFPSGAFSHSFGLETAIADGRVASEAELLAWIDAYLVDAWATLDGAALVFAMRDGVDARALDAIVTAATNAPEMRAANARMTGAAFDTFAAMGCADARLDAYRDDVRAGRATGVNTLAFALVYSALGIAWRDAFVACASTLLSGLAAVGTRAIPLGQRATARVLWTLRASIERARAEAESIETPEDLCTQAVGQEIDALRHRLLDGRMFAS